MKFCQAHWDRLKQAIDDRGLSALVAHDGAEAVRRLGSELDAGSERQNFEPLLWAHNAITARALDALGLFLLSPTEDGGDRCPICTMQEEHDKACSDPRCRRYEEGWINGAADDALTQAIELGLVGSG